MNCRICGRIDCSDPDKHFQPEAAPSECVHEAAHRIMGRIHKCAKCGEQFQIEPAQPSECSECDTGFPIKDGMHYGTQSLGMIPNTPCKRSPAQPSEIHCSGCGTVNIPLNEIHKHAIACEPAQPDSDKARGKWYGKIGYDNEGACTWEECATKEQAALFVKGFEYALEMSKADTDHDSLEGYWTAVDQVEPKDE